MTDELAVRTKQQLQSIGKWINDEKQVAKLAEYGRGFLDGKTLARILIMSCSRTPQLLECSQASMLRAMAEACALKIKPGGVLGRGYLVPRKNHGVMEACFDPGWRGLCDIARRSGAVQDIDAAVVYEEELKAGRFIYRRGTEAKLVHDPIIDGSSRGKPIGAYAIATFKDGSKHFEFMPIADIEKRRQSSPGKNSPAWQNWYEEMCKKTVVRYLSKYLPFTDALEAAMQAADRADGSIDAEYEVLGEVEEPGASPPPTDPADDGRRVRMGGNGRKPAAEPEQQSIREPGDEG